MRRLGPILLTVGILGCGKSSDDPARILKFTAIPGDNTTELREKFRPLERYLTQTLGVKVVYHPTTSYAASVDAFVNGDVHLAWFGGLTGVRARAKVSGARAIAQGKVDPEYRTYFIAHRGSGLKKGEGFPHALKGKKFTFGSDGSTSGRLMPEYYIRKHTGLSPRDFFGKEMHFSQSHEMTIRMVATGTFDAGAVDYKTYDRFVREKKVNPEECTVIWVTPPYPDYNWTAHPHLDGRFGTGFLEKLQKALLEIREPKLLAAINRREGLIAAKNEEWENLAELARELGLLR